MKYSRDIPERYYGKNRHVKRLGEVFRDAGLYKIKRKKELIDDNILSVWERFVDNNIKEHGKIAGIKKGILYIEVDSHPWLHHFSNFCKQDILEIFQREADKVFVSEIRFRLSSGS